LKNITNYHKHLSLTLTCHGTKPLAPHLTRNHNRTITKFIHQIETLEHSDVITQFEASFLFGQLNKCRFLMYFHYH
jgi:tyrosine-protein phosphatase YwqE